MGYYNGNGFVSVLAVRIIAAFTIILVIVIGIGLGLSLAMTTNIINEENFVEFAPALPTRLLDINGELITEFASDEKRELVSLSELPRHLIHAVLAREDPDFFNHRGFSIRAIARAAWGQITGNHLGGGSTITQQVAGTLYTNRREVTITRKIKELWWALQMERRYTKNEILEIYLNYMPMGPGTFGVETASRYFFRKSARDVNLAESAVLAVLLSGPNRFDPIRNPELAMNRQHFVLERMVQFGYVDNDEAEASFAEFWENFDWTQAPLSAFLTREDRAPWFSEYVRRELEVLMYGSMDYFRDGYVVHTTLNLAHQEAAERYMARGLERGNAGVTALNRRSNSQAVRSILPVVNLLTLAFDLTDIHSVSAGQSQARAVSRYTRTINPIVDMLSLAFGIPELKEITGPGFAQLRETLDQNLVEGALITLENETGFITAIVGGSRYDESNQLIRATQASVQPGSAFKPLYYSAALDTRQFTAATKIYDIPMAFHNEDGTVYVPNNYGGRWRGPILLYMVMSLSLNIPSLYVLEQTGFDASINRSAALLGITDEAQIRRLFPRVYPLGLGINSTSPMQMARAFSIFANQGRVVTPIAIRTIEDRNGRVLFDVERDVRQRQRRMANNGQIITPQNAFVMTRILEFGVTAGTLALGTGAGSKFTYRDADGRTFRMPVAGKTGTTQNWSDAWVVGYTPYYTTAVWFGFDRPGNSLGINQTGAELGGPVWGDYMSEINRGLPHRSFTRPSGIVDAAVCRGSGLLPNEHCNQGAIFLPFIAGTVPSRFCDVHGGQAAFGPRLTAPVDAITDSGTSFLDFIPRLQLDLDLFPELNRETPQLPVSVLVPETVYIYPVEVQPPVQVEDRDVITPAVFDVTPVDNSPNALPERRDEPAVIPETVIQFIPREENNDGNDDYLPPWNMLD